MNRHEALAALAATDPLALAPRPEHDAHTAVAYLVREATPEPDEAADVGDIWTVPGRPNRPRWAGARGGAALAVGVVVVALAVVTGIVLGQAASRDEQPVQPATVSTTAPFIADSAGHLVSAVEVLDVQLDPPADNVRPAVSESDAEAVCLGPNGGCDRRTGPLVTALAYATTDSYAEIQPDGSTKRTIDHRLVWAISWPSECTASGPAPTGPSDSPPPPVVSTPCTFLALIDATSGAAVFLGSEG